MSNKPKIKMFKNQNNITQDLLIQNMVLQINELTRMTFDLMIRTNQLIQYFIDKEMIDEKDFVENYLKKEQEKLQEELKKQQEKIEKEIVVPENSDSDIIIPS